MAVEPFSLNVATGDIPTGGRRYHIEAGAEERQRLAEALGIVAIPALTADIEVRRLHGATFEVRGALSARVVQTDVVTLDPVEQEIAEEVDMALSPADEDIPRRHVPADAEEAGAVDSYRHGRIDLGVILSEHLALGLDPYPRGAGVEFEERLEDKGPDASPFAALAALRGKGE
jgi:uncharacterized protein